MGKTFRSEEDSDEYEDVSKHKKERQIKGFLQNKKSDKTGFEEERTRNVNRYFVGDDD